MKYYIAYKYSNNKDKESLKSKLEHLSDRVNSWGFDTFVLGRDVKKWKHIHFGSIKLIPVIFNNMKSCDHMVAYVDSDSFSKGLFFEVLISKLLNKRSVMLREQKSGSKFFKHFFNETFQIDNVETVEREMLPT